jgi:hypothetical protein
MAEEEFFKRYANLHPTIQHYTDPIVRLGYKTSKSKYITDTRKKGDAWISQKKRDFGKMNPIKKGKKR